LIPGIKITQGNPPIIKNVLIPGNNSINAKEGLSKRKWKEHGRKYQTRRRISRKDAMLNGLLGKGGGGRGGIVKLQMKSVMRLFTALHSFTPIDGFDHSLVP